MTSSARIRTSSSSTSASAIGCERELTQRGVTTLNNYRTLVDGELGQEEVYQKIRFYVVSDNGVVSAWTGWHNSATRSFYN